MHPDDVEVFQMTRSATEPAEASTGTSTDVPFDEALVEDVLVEEVSIDGMCGVY